MSAPGPGARSFLWACLLGAALGLCYDFLRPIKGQKRDALFLPFLGWAWLELAFGICRGDLRMAHLAGLGLGFLLWENTLSLAIRPVIAKFWKILALLWRPIEKISEKIGKMKKFLFATWKKWGTMVRNRRPKGRKPGGTPHAGIQDPHRKGEGGPPP